MVTCWIFPPCLPGQESSSLASGCKLQGGACPGTPALLTSPYKPCSRQDSCLHSSAYYCFCFQPGQTHSIWRLEAVVLSKTANLKVANDGWQAISSGLRYVQLRNLPNPMLLNHLFQLSIHAFKKKCDMQTVEASLHLPPTSSNMAAITERLATCRGPSGSPTSISQGIAVWWTKRLQWRKPILGIWSMFRLGVSNMFHLYPLLWLELQIIVFSQHVASGYHTRCKKSY